VPAAEQVQMQVIHRLPTIITGVHNDPVAFAQLLIARNLASRSHQRSHQSHICSNCTCRRSNVPLRNDQHVCRRLRIDVGKTNAKFVFIDAACRNIPVDDPAEEAFGRL